MNCDRTKEEIGYLKMFTTLMYATLVSLASWTVNNINFTMATFWISILALLILLAIIVILNISTYKLIKTL